MKHFFVPFLLVLSAECAPSPQFSLSSLTEELGKLLPSWPLINQAEAPAIHREKAKRAVFTYGPLRVKAKGDVSMLGL